MKRYFLLLTSLIFALLLVGTVAAQDIQPLSYGTPVSGSISGTNFEQKWSLGTASADRLTVRVTRTSGNLIPDVSLLDDSGTPLAQSYGPDRTSAAAVIENFSLPAAGTYTIQVGRDGGETGETKGGYSLEVTPLGTGVDNPNNETVIGDLQPETPASGEVTATHWRHLYTYTAPAPDVIRVVVERTSGTLLPQVAILDSSGTALSNGYNDNAIADTGAYELPAAGQYTIAVSRYSEQNGSTLGTFDLTVHLVGAGEDSPLLLSAPGTVIYDQPAQGIISAAKWYEDWMLTTTAADTLTLTVDRADGDLVPEVVLLGGSGQELTHGYSDSTSAHAEIIHYSLSDAGSYTVRVVRYNQKRGESVGAYTLNVLLDGAGEDSATLHEPVGTIAEREPVEGEITNAQWENVWTFTSIGDPITATVKRDDGTLVPLLEIRDANGQPLTSAYYSSTRDTAEIASYNPPGAGEYQIVVSRDSGQAGYTSGAYTLTVSR
ncbi:MAG: hypothetical protein ABI835_12715 [Chloroflexota bacterium]